MSYELRETGKKEPASTRNRQEPFDDSMSPKAMISTATTEKLPTASYTEHAESFFTAGRRQGSPDHGIDSHASLSPARSTDPLNPLNLSLTRKLLACGFLCLFGAMAAAAELILGAMLPIFVLQYAGIDPKTIISFEDIQLPPGTDPLRLLSSIPGAPRLDLVYLLGSLPVLFIGVFNLVMVPMATAIGRRPVILACGVIAIIGAVWSGNSGSLGSHLAARCFQAFGAGTVESLIPFVVSDLTHEHQRNTWMSFVFATQGLIIVALGFGAPYVIIYVSWRWLYFITAIGASVFIIGVFFFLPETRWTQSASELCMSCCQDPCKCDGQAKGGIPANRLIVGTPRTWKSDLALFHGEFQWRNGLRVFTDALTTLFYPQILFIVALNSTMIGALFAAGFTAAPPLIVQPWGWPFFRVTLCLIPILIASLGTVLITGRIADAVSNWGARRRPDGRRTAEDQLLNLALPAASGLVGTLLFGIAGGNPSSYPWTMFLAGLGLMAFGFLGCNTVGVVYVLECYPEMYGSALLSIASIRYIIAFFLSFHIADWIVDLGYARSFMIFSILMAVFVAMIPALWYFGPGLKKRFPGKSTFK